MDKQQVQKMYLSFLQEEGYKGELDEEGDVFFKFESGLYYFFIDDEEDTYLHLVYPNFWPLESDNELLKAYFMANEVNRKYKIGKIIIIGNEKKNVTADIGLFLNQPGDFKNYFKRLLGILQVMVGAFTEGMNAE